MDRDLVFSLFISCDWTCAAGKLWPPAKMWLPCVTPGIDPWPFCLVVRVSGGDLCSDLSCCENDSCQGGHLGGQPRAFKRTPLSDDQSCDVWVEAGWCWLGRRGDVDQLTMLAAGKRILPWLFKQGMSCCLISTLYSRALRSHRFVTSLFWPVFIHLCTDWWSVIKSLYRGIFIHKALLLHFTWFCCCHMFSAGQKGLGLCSHWSERKDGGREEGTGCVWVCVCMWWGGFWISVLLLSLPLGFLHQVMSQK